MPGSPDPERFAWWRRGGGSGCRDLLCLYVLVGLACLIVAGHVAMGFLS